MNFIAVGHIRVFAKENFDANLKLLMVAALKVPIPVNYISFHASESSQNEYYYGCPYNVRRTDLYVTAEAHTNEQNSYTKTQVYSECTNVGVYDEYQIQFHDINDIRGSQPDGYLIRVPFFVEASQDVKILLSTEKRPNFSTDKLYQIGK